MIEIDVSELEKVVENLSDTKRVTKGIENALFNASGIIAIDAKKNHEFKSRSGLAENSIFREVHDLTADIFVSDDRVPYIDWLYNGSGIYGKHKTEIVPKNAKVLAFKIGGAQFFAPSVKGYKGDAFIDKAYDRREDEFLKVFGDEVAEEIEGVL